MADNRKTSNLTELGSAVSTDILLLVRGGIPYKIQFGNLTIGSVSSVAPTTSTSSGTAGTLAYDSNYIYICVATNTWKRIAIGTW